MVERSKSFVAWSVLGADTVSVDGVPIALTNRVRQILLRLLVEPNLVVPVDRLADALWADNQLPKSIRNSISRFVADLRQSLGAFSDRIESQTGGGYRLRVEPDELDLDVASKAIAVVSNVRTDDSGGPSTTTIDPQEFSAAIAKLRDLVAKVGVGTNPHLGGLQRHEAIERSYTELRISMIEALAIGLGHEQQYPEMISLLERVIVEHEYHERFWHLLMQALMATGRDLEAFQAGTRLEQLLGELGVIISEPVGETQSVLRDRLGAAATTEPPIDHAGPVDITTTDIPTTNVASTMSLATVSPATVSLTTMPTIDRDLVGRVDDLRAVQRLVESERIVTIIGLGGTGKTRLAIGLGAALGETMPVHYLDLRTVTDTSAVVPLAAAALGIASADAADATGVAKAVAHQTFAIVIDNCEHLVDPCAELISAFAGHVAGAHVLATSRVAIGAPSEATYPLAPLSIVAGIDVGSGNDGPSDAARLFMTRAQRWIGSELSAKDQATIERLCRALNGLPLAIEIAAAQLAIMTLDQLGQRTSKAFASNQPALEPAVAAMTDILDWTWTNLSPSQQALLARLSIFASGWTEEAAVAVRAGPGSITADLQRLIALSLVVAAPDTSRQAMLVPVREYAAARLDDLGETDVMGNRLASWALDLTARWSFPQHHLWSAPNDVLLPEHGNLLAALTYLEAKGRIADVVTLAVASSGMMVNRGLARELVRWIEPHVKDETLDTEIRGLACVALGAAFHTTGDLEDLSAIGSKGLAFAAGRPFDWVPIMSGYMSVWSLVAPADITTDELSEISFAAAEGSPSRRINLAVASLYRAHVEFVSRNYDEALRLFRAAHDNVDQQGRGLLIIEIGITLSLFMLERHDEARSSIDAWRSKSDTDHWHYINEIVRAIVNGATGDSHKATTELSAAVRALPESNAWGRAGIIQTAYAMLADYRGESDLATELFASAVNRDILLLSVAISHVMAMRGLTGDEAWLEVGIEFWTRIVAPGSGAATATSTPQLLRWWSSGQLD